VKLKILQTTTQVLEETSEFYNLTPNALNWLQKHNPEYKNIEHIIHAKPEDIEGNIVIDMLPIHMTVLAKEYWNL